MSLFLRSKRAYTCVRAFHKSTWTLWLIKIKSLKRTASKQARERKIEKGTKADLFVCLFRPGLFERLARTCPGKSLIYINSIWAEQIPQLHLGSCFDTIECSRLQPETDRETILFLDDWPTGRLAGWLDRVRDQAATSYKGNDVCSCHECPLWSQKLSSKMPVHTINFLLTRGPFQQPFGCILFMEQKSQRNPKTWTVRRWKVKGLEINNSWLASTWCEPCWQEVQNLAKRWTTYIFLIKSAQRINWITTTKTTKNGRLLQQNMKRRIKVKQLAFECNWPNDRMKQLLQLKQSSISS